MDDVTTPRADLSGTPQNLRDRLPPLTLRAALAYTRGQTRYGNDPF